MQAGHGTKSNGTVAALAPDEQSRQLRRAVIASTVVDTLIAAGVSQVTVPLWGHLSDRFGRRRTCMFGALAMALFAWPYFALRDTRVLRCVFHAWDVEET